MKRNVSVDRFKFRCNILISGKIIKEMPGSVASGAYCTAIAQRLRCCATNRKVAGSILAGVNGFFIHIKFFR